MIEHSAISILVLDDEPFMLEVLLHMLGRLGFDRVATADNGASALAALASAQPPNLILCDLNMPEMDGYQLVRAIRAGECATRRRPIVALTASTLQGEAERCRAAGMDDFLVKPLQLARLKAALETWLPGRTPVVDVSVLEALVGDDVGVILSFLQQFGTSAGLLGAQLKAACVKRQPAYAAAQAHKLKSAARTVGALGLGEVCSSIEATDSADAQLALLPDFERELDAVIAFLEAYNAASI